MSKLKLVPVGTLVHYHGQNEFPSFAVVVPVPGDRTVDHKPHALKFLDYSKTYTSILYNVPREDFSIVQVPEPDYKEPELPIGSTVISSSFVWTKTKEQGWVAVDLYTGNLNTRSAVDDAKAREYADDNKYNKYGYFVYIPD